MKAKITLTIAIWSFLLIAIAILGFYGVIIPAIALTIMLAAFTYVVWTTNQNKTK